MLKFGKSIIMKKFDEAVEYLKIGAYKKAQKFLEAIIAKEPRNAKVLTNLGIVYKNTGQQSKAIEYYLKAIEVDPKMYEAYNNLANIYLLRNEFELAKKSFEKAIKIKPNYADGYGNLGAYYQTKQNKALAKRFYNKAEKYGSKSFEVLFNYSSLLESEGNYEKAYELAKQAFDIDAGNTAVCSIMANSLRGLGQLEEARKYYERAIEIDPYLTSVYPNLLDVLTRLGDKKQANLIHKKMDELGAETPYWSLKLHKSLKHRLDTARSFSSRIKSEAQRIRTRLGYWIREDKEKIKIGYVYNKIDNNFFDLHDKYKFEVFKFPYKEIRNFTDAQVAKRINKKRIDILVDLEGHSENNRMGIFAHHPSPFQVGYLGFSGTSGAEFIEYKIVDRKSVPTKDVKYYSEGLIYINNCSKIDDPKVAKQVVSDMEKEFEKIVTPKG